MPQNPKDDPTKTAEPAPPAEPSKDQDESDIGDFITRHVLEKDSVFFEG